MKNPTLISSQTKQRPILIVDRKGYIGEELAKRLSESFIVVFVAPRLSQESENLIHVPFLKKIPTIPDNYYSHIFLVDDGEAFFHSVETFIKKASGDGARLVLIEGIRSSSQKSIDETKFYKNASTVFYGDLFGEDRVLSVVGQFILDAKKSRKINVEGEGLEEVYPVDISDFVDLLVEQIFVRENLSKVINIFPRLPLTKLTLSHIFQSIDPLIKIDFIPAKKEKEVVHIENADYVLPDNYDLKGRIKNILEKDLDEDFGKEEPLTQQVEEKKYLKSAFLLLILFMIFFISLPLTTTLAYSSLGLYEVDGVRTNLEKGNLDAALKSAQSANNFFTFAEKTIVPLKSESALVGRTNFVNTLEVNIQAGESVSQASIDLINSSRTIQAIISGKSQNPSSDFDTALSLMKNSIAEFRKIEVQKTNFGNLQQKLSDVNPVVNLLSNSIDVLPTVLGFDGQQTYLILFQNNMELRPGGGFIGSYGLLTMNQGSVKNFKIYNVYDADGQLKGHVEPPFQLRKYLPQPNWYLRDSNFDIDFPKNASSAAFFLNLETGQKVNGVAAVDIDFVKNILKAIGPVNVSDYSVEVDDTNLFQITEEKSQNNSFAGSTQKQDFLSSLMDSISQKLGNFKGLPYLSLAKALSDSLNQKHILLASDDPQIQGNFSVNNWSSQVPQNVSSGSGTFNDFLGINEANLGINKVNYFVSRSVSKAQMIDGQGNLSSTVTVSYKNDSPSQTYRNYLRFILPANISVSEISFDDVAQQIIPEVKDPTVYQSKNYKAPTGLQVDQEQEDGKTVVGFLVQIPPDGLKTISLTYNLNYSIPLGSEIDYNFSYFKQPGTEDTPFDLSLYYPSGYTVLQKVPGSVSSSGKIGVSQILSTDTNFSYSLTQN